MLAAGFTVSMAIGGNTTPQMPNATNSPAAIYSQNNNNVVIVFKGQSPLDSWIKKLAILESEGKSNIKVLDHNGLHSFGCLQFQMGTFEEYGLKYNLISANDEINKLIYDCDLQKEMAKRMIQENPNNWEKWYTSVVIKGLGLPPKEEKAVLVSLK
ncbi:MAG: hypothetical protein AAB536_00760 [Patescibacteria group bacterium]